MKEGKPINVSIVIPVYKVSAYIADCLRSVCAQTYPHIEVILVNDATPDDSMEQAAPWIQQMQERGYAVQVVNHPENKGLSAARNTGIKAATTEWVYFLDSDDELTPQCIEWMVEQVKLHPSVDFVIGGIKVVGSNWSYPLTCRPYVDTNREILQDYTASKWYVMAWNHLYRKSYLLEHNLFFREGLLHEDELYSFQVATTARAMATVYEETYIYKVRSAGSITSQRKLKNFEDMLIIAKEKYVCMLQKYQAKDFSVPFGYGLDVMFDFMSKLVVNRALDWHTKIQLMDRYKAIFQIIRPWRENMPMSLSIKYRLLLLLWSFPSSIAYQMMNLYLVIK